MKNTYISGIVLCLALLSGLSGWSQFRQYEQGREEGPNGEPVPVESPRGGRRPVAPSGPEAEFDFTLRFNDIGVLLELENAILGRQKKAVDEWFQQQQGTFLREINRQLGTSHTNFRNAQRDYFKNFEQHFRGLNSEASRLARGRFDLADQQENEQLTYSGELYFINDFKESFSAQSDCNFDYPGLCDFTSQFTEKVQGFRLSDIRNYSQITNLENLALEDFARTEYEPAVNRRCGIGLNKIRNNGFLANRFANAHLSYYDDRDLRNKVFLMTAYLNITGSNIRPPFALPIQRVQIPGPFWDSSTLLELGKDNGPFEGEEAKVFLEGYIAWRVNRAINIPSQESPEAVFNRLNAIRDRVIAEHLREYEKSEEKLNFDFEKINKNSGNPDDPVIGTIGGYEALAYTETIPHRIPGDNPNNPSAQFYRLKNGGWAYSRNTAINNVNGGRGFQDSSLNDDGNFYYVLDETTDAWHEVLLPSSGLDFSQETFLVTQFWELMKGVGRYALPIEDVFILMDGKDFDGNEANQAVAGVFVIIEIIPGVGKVIKVVSKLLKGKKAIAFIAKSGNKALVISIGKSGEAASVLRNARKIAGKAKGDGVLIKNKWLRGTDGNAGFFPKSVADRMRGKNYANFDAFRIDFWKNVAKESKLANQFSQANRTRMSNGLAPKVRNTQNLGGQSSYVLHHKTPINRGGGVYDVDNLLIVTPKFHKEVLSPGFHFGYGY